MSPLLILCIIVVFLLGLNFYLKGGSPKFIEEFANEDELRCPNILIQSDKIFYLYNSKLANIPGVNPVKFNNLEGYIAHFEEDFGPILGHDNWYNDSKKLLTDDIQYVGESTIGRIKIADPNTGQNDDGRLISQPGGTRLALPEVWTDGGYYFTTISKLKVVETSIGIFHKGNQNTKYTNFEDGISLGEVGFPTLLHHAGFKFACLIRHTYFNNEWCGGH